jgi:multiple sugar transport system permease protein
MTKVATGSIGAALFALPLLFMVLTSLRSPGLPPPDGFELLPREATWETYEFVFLLIPLWGQIGNSLLVVGVAVPVTVVVASLAGFAIAVSRGAPRRVLLIVTVAAMTVPLSALWIPRFVLFRWLGLTDSLASLMAPALMGTTPFYVLIFALAYARISTDLYAAARLDGWSPLGIWRRVAFPLAKPAAFAVAILAFVAHWSNFSDALLYLNDETLATVPLGLRQLQTLEPQNFPILLAASVIVTLPSVVAFLIAQRAFFSRTLRL